MSARLDIVPARVDVRATADESTSFTVSLVDEVGAAVDWPTPVEVVALRRPRRSGAPEDVVAAATVTGAGSTRTVTFDAGALDGLVSRPGWWYVAADGRAMIDGELMVLPRGDAGGSPSTSAVTVTAGDVTVEVTTIGGGGATLAVSDTATWSPTPDPNDLVAFVVGLDMMPTRAEIAAMSAEGYRSAGDVVDGELVLPPLGFEVLVSMAETALYALPGALVAGWNFPFTRSVTLTNPANSGRAMMPRGALHGSAHTDACNLTMMWLVTSWSEGPLEVAFTQPPHTYQPDVPSAAWMITDPAFSDGPLTSGAGIDPTDVVVPEPTGATPWLSGHTTGGRNGVTDMSEALRLPDVIVMPGETIGLMVVLAVGVPAGATVTGTTIHGSVEFSGGLGGI